MSHHPPPLTLVHILLNFKHFVNWRRCEWEKGFRTLDFPLLFRLYSRVGMQGGPLPLSCFLVLVIVAHFTKRVLRAHDREHFTCLLDIRPEARNSHLGSYARWQMSLEYSIVNRISQRRKNSPFQEALKTQRSSSKNSPTTMLPHNTLQHPILPPSVILFSPKLFRFNH